MCLRLPQCAADEESNEIFICVCVGQVKEEFKTNHLLSNPLPSRVNTHAHSLIHTHTPPKPQRNMIIASDRL